MEANQVKSEVEVVKAETRAVETTRDIEALRELSALELSLVGGGQGSVVFM